MTNIWRIGSTRKNDKLLSNSNSLERLRELYRKSIQGKEGRGGPFALSTKSTFAVDTCTFGEGKSVEEQHEVVKQIEGHGMKKSPGS